MAKEKARQPTDAELEILTVLWERGPSTVRDVQEVIGRSKPTGYTTVLKLLQIMTEKGLVRRNEEQRAHVYEPCLAKEQTQRQLLGDLLERAFDGSAANLVMQALSTKKASPDELAHIREILDELEGGNS
jgi:BlaI family transcriptional regulator, penicillinase repressor